MDEWEQIRSQLRELQGALHLGASHPSGPASPLPESPSISDYWKRRADEERVLWQEKLLRMENERRELQSRLLEDERKIQDLAAQVRAAEEKSHGAPGSKEDAARRRHEEDWKRNVDLLKRENDRLKIVIAHDAEKVGREAARAQEAQSAKEALERQIKALREKDDQRGAQDAERVKTLEGENQFLQIQLKELNELWAKVKSKSEDYEKEIQALKEERDRGLKGLEEKQREYFLEFEDLTRGFARRMRTFLEMMEGLLRSCEGKQEDPHFPRKIELLAECAREMSRSVEEFQILSKMPSYNPKPVSLPYAVEAAVRSVQSVLEARQIRFEAEISKDLPRVFVDEDLIIEALKEILLNAAEASAAGSGVRLGASYKPALKRIAIEISDQGEGIPEDDLKRVFQPYFTTRKGKKGLGLVTARRAVDLHYGTLTLQSALGRGTTVYVDIPVTRTVPSD